MTTSIHPDLAGPPDPAVPALPEDRMPGDALFARLQQIGRWRSLPYLVQLATLGGLALVSAPTGAIRSLAVPSNVLALTAPSLIAAAVALWAAVGALRDQRLMSQVEAEVADPGVRNPNGKPVYLIARFACQHVRRARLVMAVGATLAVVPVTLSMGRYGPIIGATLGCAYAAILVMGGFVTAVRQTLSPAAVEARLRAGARTVALTHVPADALRHAYADIVLARLGVAPDSDVVAVATKLLETDLPDGARLTDLVTVAQGVLHPGGS